MKSEIQISHHKSQILKGCCFESSTPWRKSPGGSSQKYYGSQKMINDGVNYNCLEKTIDTKIPLKRENQSLFILGSQCELQNSDLKSRNFFQSINKIEQKRLNFTEISPTQEERNLQNKSQNKESNKKIAIEKLIEKYRSCKQELHKSKKEIQTFRSEKVEYEEIVYNLKTENAHLSSILQKTCREFYQVKENYNKKKERNSFVSNTINILLKTENKISFQQIHAQKHSSSCDLQLILDDMKRKIKFYQKDIVEKQILNNHQFYLLERLKKQQNQLSFIKASLLDELKFVLAKNEKLKRENEEIKNENEERIRQIFFLEEMNAKFVSEIKELLQKVKELQKLKVYSDQKEQSTSVICSESVLSSNLIDNLNEICQVLDKKSKVGSFKIIQSFNIKIVQKQKISALKFIQKEVSCVQDFHDQLRQRDEKIIALKEELKQALDFQEELNIHLQCTKSKLSQLAKDLSNLHLQHEALKHKVYIDHQQITQQSSSQNIRNESLVKIISSCQMTTKEIILSQHIISYEQQDLSSSNQLPTHNNSMFQQQ